MEAGGYYTLCVDSKHDEGFRRFFARHIGRAQELLDGLPSAASSDEVDKALERLITEALDPASGAVYVQQDEWRYGFLRYPALMKNLAPWVQAHWRIYHDQQLGTLLLSSRTTSAFNWQVQLLTIEYALRERLDDYQKCHPNRPAGQHCARLVATEDNATRIHLTVVRGKTLRDGRCLILPGDAQHPQIEVTYGGDADKVKRAYHVSAEMSGGGGAVSSARFHESADVVDTV